MKKAVVFGIVALAIMTASIIIAKTGDPGMAGEFTLTAIIAAAVAVLSAVFIAVGAIAAKRATRDEAKQINKEGGEE